MQRLIRFRSSAILHRTLPPRPLFLPQIRTMASEQAALHKDPVTGEMISKTCVFPDFHGSREGAHEVLHRSASSSVVLRRARSRRRRQKRLLLHQLSQQPPRPARRMRRSSPRTYAHTLSDSGALLDTAPQQYFEIRSRQIMKLKETQSPNPYPHKFHVSISITDYIDKYGPEGKIQPGQKLEGVTESLAGRIHNVRASGQNLRFYDLHSEGGKAQITANKQCVLLMCGAASHPPFRLLAQGCRVTGRLHREP